MEPKLFLPRRFFGGLPPPYDELNKSRIVVLPVPYDGTSDWHGGARDGPRAIIDASQYLELYDQELDREIYTVGIHTLPELQPAMGGPGEMVERVCQVVGDILDMKKIPVVLGGEHSLTLGAVRACFQHYPGLSVLALDAHGDLRDSYLGTKFSHAAVMRRVWELTPPVQVGVRSLSLEERQFLAGQERQPLFFQGEVWDEEFIGRVVSCLNPRVYVTIDVDVLDPSIMAAVSNPDPGGVGWYPLLALLRGVSVQRQVVGFDIMELCPREGPVACAFLAARLAYKLMGYITKDARITP